MDVIVIGGGIAGVSIAYELADQHTVTLLEAERSLAVHTTGRSAATWIGSYGPPGVRAYSADSLPWLLEPPFETDGPIATPLTCLWIARAGASSDIEKLARETGLDTISGADAEVHCPVLNPGVVELAAIDETAKELDVAALHHGYTKSFRARGGKVVTGARIADAKFAGGQWTLTSEAGDSFVARVVVNAAGAWADMVGSIFGAQPQGLVPRRRSIFQSPTNQKVAGLPFTAEVSGSFYFKPEGDAVLCSPADATDTEPGDPKPDELEIARTIEEINKTTTLGLRSVRTAWAGLRTFGPTGEPIVEWDASVDGLFWFAGQGGYGIQMGPALAQFGAQLVLDR